MTHTRFAAAAALALVVLLARPRPAAADVRLTGFGGVSFVNETRTRAHYRAAITFGGLFGFEFEAARMSLGEIAEEIDFANIDVDAHLTTYMFNAVVRLPDRGQSSPTPRPGPAWRGQPAAWACRSSAGVDAHAQDFGWNFGGGLYMVPLPFFALRGDVRRFQTGELLWDDIADLDTALPDLDFWRATAGLTFKF